MKNMFLDLKINKELMKKDGKINLFPVKRFYFPINIEEIKEDKYLVFDNGECTETRPFRYDGFICGNKEIEDKVCEYFYDYEGKGIPAISIEEIAKLNKAVEGLVEESSENLNHYKMEIEFITSDENSNYEAIALLNAISEYIRIDYPAKFKELSNCSLKINNKIEEEI